VDGIYIDITGKKIVGPQDEANDDSFTKELNISAFFGFFIVTESIMSWD
jgi:hypothetical protein